MENYKNGIFRYFNLAITIKDIAIMLSTFRTERIGACAIASKHANLTPILSHNPKLENFIFNDFLIVRTNKITNFSKIIKSGCSSFLFQIRTTASLLLQ